MNKTGKSLPQPAPLSHEQLQEAALRVCQEADEAEEEIRQFVGNKEVAVAIFHKEVLRQAARTLETISSEREADSEKHRRIVNFCHDQPNGTREKRRRIQKEWASGQYSSRNACANACSEALGVSFSTARKALKCEPDTMERKSPVEWLRDFLEGATQYAADVYREAAAAGFSKDAMKRAKASLGVEVIVCGRLSQWRF